MQTNKERFFKKVEFRLGPGIFLLILILSACSNKLHTAKIVLLPDTQTYAEKYPHILDSQVNWIVRNAKHINFVLQQGDLTQNNNDKEWNVVQSAFSKLNNKVPYVLALGNHDMGSEAGKFADVRNSTLYNKYFPYSQVSSLPGFAGAFENGKTDNAYYLFKTGKIKWLVLNLEFGPRESVVKWANDIAKQFPDRLVILNTHSYMYSDSTRQGGKDYWRAQGYGVGKDKGDSAVNDGDQLWTKLVKNHPNFRFTFSGHILNSGVGTLVSINDAGLPVYQMLANYQEGVEGSQNGGNGYLRIIDLNFKKKTINVSTYSPYLDKFYNKPGHNFIIKHVLFKTAE